MCDQKTIDDIDAGKKVAISKRIIQGVAVFLLTGIIGWLITVVIYVQRTEYDILNNSVEIVNVKERVIVIEDWKNKQSYKEDELLHNLKRLLKANGLEWEKFNPYK